MGQGGSYAGAFALGLRAGYSVAAFVLFATALGFGALARDAGFTLGQVAFLSLTMFALPNQVVLIDQLARGATIAGAAMAVTLAAVRLFPMVAATMPTLHGPQRRPALEVLAAHFVAVTTWIEGTRRLPAVAPDLRLAHHLGIGVAVCIMMMLGSVAGFLLTGGVPAAVSAALVFTTPLYFIMSLVMSSQSRMDMAAIVLGCGLAPLLYLIVPGFDLLATGLIGGTLAYLWGARRAMTVLQDGFGGYLTLLLAGFLANECWRWLGVAAGSRLDLAGQPFLWVRAVALALVAGLVSRMILFPAGALANVPLAIRVGAFAGGIALYVLARRNLAVGVVGGAVLLMTAQMLVR